MEDKGRGVGGKTALHVLAFIGVTVLLLAIAAGAALYIATKGPSDSAREAVYDWAGEHGLGSVAGIFLSAEEKDALADVPGEDAPEDEEQPAESERPMITVTDEIPEEASPAPEESEIPADDGGDTEPEGGEEAEA